MKQEPPSTTSSFDPFLESFIDPTVLDNLTPEQWTAIEKYIFNRKGKKQRKLVDIRFSIDLVMTRFFIVLLVGKDRRNKARNYPLSRLINVGNIVAAILLLVGANLVISASIVLILYLIKSALGIDLMPGHINQTLKGWMK
jgi:hypothetical protein